MFKHIKLTTTSGHNWTTSVNPNSENEEIRVYFLNNFFDIGVYPDEKMEKCIKVEFLFNASFNGKIKGALGIEETFSKIEVFGEDEEKAKINLYDNYDHITNLKLSLNLD